MLRLVNGLRPDATGFRHSASYCYHLAMKLPQALVLFIFLTFACIGLYAQDTDPIRIDTSIVRLNVGVVDHKGRPITNLDKDSFDLFEDGQKQQITKFEPSSAPFSVVILLDMSGSTIGFRPVIKQSAFRFIDALAPDDRVAVVEFYDKINLRNDFTTDRHAIANSSFVIRVSVSETV